MDKFTLYFIFKYSSSELDTFLSQFTKNVYDNLDDKRYMALYYLYENNLLDQESKTLLENNSEKFRELLKISNTAEELRNNLYLKMEDDIIEIESEKYLVHKNQKVAEDKYGNKKFLIVKNGNFDIGEYLPNQTLKIRKIIQFSYGDDGFDSTKVVSKQASK